jgi:hypothetical protein
MHDENLTPDQKAALERSKGDPVLRNRFLSGLLDSSTMEEYLWEAVTHLQCSIEEVHDAHVRACEDPVCRTCQALTVAAAAADAVDLAEVMRCECGQHHFTTADLIPSYREWAREHEVDLSTVKPSCTLATVTALQ